MESLRRTPDPLNERRRKVGIVARRSEQQFFIVDRFMNVLHRSAEVSVALCTPEILQRLASVCQDARHAGRLVVEALDDDIIFQIVPLSGSLAGCCEVFVNSFERRSIAMIAAKKFSLTKREIEFIPMLLQGLTSADMAEKLCVAESTVADHMKSIMRKTGAKKRVEVISRLYSLEAEDLERKSVC